MSIELVFDQLRKCLRPLDGLKRLADAAKSCRAIGGTIFAPSDVREIQELYLLSRTNQATFKLRWKRDFIWIGYKIKIDGSFPPGIIIHISCCLRK